MRKQYSFLLLALTLLLSACSSEDESMEGILPPAIAGLESEYTLLAGEELTFAPPWKTESMPPAFGHWTVRKCRAKQPTLSSLGMKHIPTPFLCK